MIDEPLPLTGIILAGGRGHRMGQPKALLTLGGRTVLEIVSERLRPLCNEILIVSSAEVEAQLTEGKDRAGVLWPNGTQVLHDLDEDKGPLCGLVTGLEAASNDAAFVVSCDAPFVSAELGRLLLSRLEGFDAVVPEWEGRLQSLQAVYTQKAGAVARQCLERNRLALRDLLKDESLRVHTVLEAEWRSCGVSPQAFTNLNTPEDLETVSRLLDPSID